MKSNQTALRGAFKFALAIGFCSVGTAWAADTVDFVDITTAGGIYINDGKIVVTPVNGEYAQVTSGNTVTFHKQMKAGCKGLSNVLKSTTMYFGIATTSGGIMEANNLYSVGVAHQHAKSIGYKEAVMNVPLNKLGYNPVQVCKNMLQHKMNSGLTKMQVMNSDQIVKQNASFSAVASCGKLGNSSGYYDRDTIGGSIDVICKAGASGPVNQIQLKEAVKPTVPAGGNNNIQAGYQPLIITDASILADTLHYTGQCPKELNFTVRIKGQGRGGIKYRINDGMSHVKSSGSMIYDGKNGWLQDAFTFTVKLDQQKINQPVPHKFDLTVEYRDGQAQGLAWKKFEGAMDLNWNHKCLASPTVSMGQQNGIQTQNPNAAKPQQHIQRTQQSQPPQQPNRARQ